MEDITFAYMFGRQVEATKDNVAAFLHENLREFKEIVTEFHNFFFELAKRKGEVDDGRISHRLAVLVYSAVKTYFFSNWRLADIDWPDILALEAALTEIAMRIADGVKEDTEKKGGSDINIR